MHTREMQSENKETDIWQTSNAVTIIQSVFHVVIGPVR